MTLVVSAAKKTKIGVCVVLLGDNLAGVPGFDFVNYAHVSSLAFYFIDNSHEAVS